jgi:hypothetical protein
MMMRKADITFHHVGYSDRAVPAVNVKRYSGPTPEEWNAVQAETGRTFNSQWIDRHLTDDDADLWWQAACSDGWERLQDAATEIFGKGAKVYSEGRSGGWVCVDGFSANDVETWDALAVSRWGNFARACQRVVDDLGYQYLMLIYMNVFEPWQAEQDEIAKLAELRMPLP